MFTEYSSHILTWAKFTFSAVIESSLRASSTALAVGEASDFSTGGVMRA
jgi:hypothetical protein